jgi:cell division protein FtsQ
MSPRRDDDSTLEATPKRYRQQPGQPRRRVGKRMWGRTAVAAGSLLGLALVSGGGYWLWQSGLMGRALDGTRDRFVEWTASSGLVVGEILVTGRIETGRDELLKALGLVRGAPILAFDPEALKSKIETLPWIKSASVQRLLPDTVVVRLVERPALALWQREGKFSLIDYDGRVIPVSDIAKFSDLLVVVGNDAPTHAADLIRLLGTQPTLMPLVKAAVRVGARRWNINLQNGIEVMLPEDDPAGAWAQLAEYERDHQIFSRDVQALDLRLPGRLIVKTKTEPAPPPAPKKGGRAT